MIAHGSGSVPPRRRGGDDGAGVGSMMVVGRDGHAVKLVGVSSHDNAVLIESTEPVAYAASRPDPLTLLVDLRNVSVADARASVGASGAVAGVELEQAVGGGRRVARARPHVADRAVEYQVRSARNTIRVELTPGGGEGAPPPATSAPAAQTALSSSRRIPAPRRCSSASAPGVRRIDDRHLQRQRAARRRRTSRNRATRRAV